MSIGRHTIYNLTGSIAPMFVSVLSVPVYLHLVGDTRYGVLSIVWLFLGYFGIFDPGLTQAATYHIARLHDAPAKERGDVFWTALVVNLGFGIVGGVVLYLVARPLFVSAFKMPEAMRHEVMASLPWLAASVPVSIVSGVLGSALQAREWFGVSNMINVLNIFLTQITPLAVAYFHGPDLIWLIPAILLARAIGAVPQFIAVSLALPLGAGGGFKKSLLKQLFSYGGWITISNLLNPILTSADRMLIGGLLGAEAVAYYTVPFNLISRVSVIPGALAGSLFPKLSRRNKVDSGRLASDAVAGLSAVMTPLIVTGIVALPIFMKLWVGTAFAVNAVPVGMILLIGIWANGLAYIPYGHLQASNRPDVTAKFHLAELVPFLAVLWIGLHYFGLEGAAWAWTLRATVDAILLFAIAGQLQGWIKLLPGLAIVAVAPLCAPGTIGEPKTLLALLVVAISLIWSWKVSPVMRNLLLDRLYGRFLKRA
jgi:O-antigen/teichoic acid export membrane protein